jgi:tetratricopeptide (TPR) repeat protein
LDLGKSLQATGGKQEALQSYLTAAEMDPSDATPLFLAGQLYAEETRTLPDAIRMYQRVLKINPRYPLAHVQVGWAYLKQGNQQEAIREAMEERAINPGLADAYILAAEAYYSNRQFSNCAKEYQAAVSKGLASTQIYIKMARCYRLSGSLDSALSLLNQAKDRENGNADIYKELGAVYHVKGAANEAIAAYQQYLNLAPIATDREEIQGYINKLESGDTSFGDEKEKP